MCLQTGKELQLSVRWWFTASSLLLLAQLAAVLVQLYLTLHYSPAELAILALINVVTALAQPFTSLQLVQARPLLGTVQTKALGPLLWALVLVQWLMVLPLLWFDELWLAPLLFLPVLFLLQWAQQQLASQGQISALNRIDALMLIVSALGKYLLATAGSPVMWLYYWQISLPFFTMLLFMRASAWRGPALPTPGHSWRRSLALLRHYRSFALYQFPAQWLNLASNALPLLALGSLNLLTEAGLWSFAVLCVSSLSLVSSRLVTPWLTAQTEQLMLKPLSIQGRWCLLLSIKLGSLYALAYSLVVMLAPLVFPVVLPPQWWPVSDWLLPFSVWYLTVAINPPALKLLQVHGWQAMGFVLNALTLLLRLGAVALLWWSVDVYLVLWLFALIGVVHNLSLVGLVYGRTQRGK